VRRRDGRGGGLAAAGAGRDEQVGFFVLQVGDPFPAAGQGGQVDLVGGQVVPVEPGQRGRGGRVRPGRVVGAERAAQVPADDLVDVFLPGGVGVPGGRVGQRDLRILVAGEPFGDVEPAAGAVGLVGVEVLAELEVTSSPGGSPCVRTATAGSGAIRRSRRRRPARRAGSR